MRLADNGAVQNSSSDLVSYVCHDSGLSQCARRCSRHACSPVTTDNLTCVSAVTPIPDCGNSCDRYKLDFGRRDGFVRYVWLPSMVECSYILFRLL